MKKVNEILPANGKLGVLTPGMGAVSTTFAAGVLAIKQGFSQPIGSLTQMGTIRLGKRTENRVPSIKDFVPLSGLDDLVFGGWDIFEDDMSKHIQSFASGGRIYAKEVPDPERLGVVEFDKDKKVISIEEKPIKPKSNFAVTGLYLYNEKIFEIINQIIEEIGYSKRGELEITDVNNYYVKKYKTNAIKVKGFWSDAGTFNTLIKSSNFILLIQY